MSLTCQNLLTNSHSRISFYFTSTHPQNTNFYLSLPSTQFTNPPHFQLLKTQARNPHNSRTFRTHRGPFPAFQSDGTVQKQDGMSRFNFDAFLSIAEFLCLASSAVISVGSSLNSSSSSSQNPVLVWLGSRVSMWQCVLLVGGVVIGAAIRRRQWRRICVDISKPGSSFNLVNRIEKLEEDLRGSATIIRVMSRHLEKLGTRFRVTRKALKEPISETAALAQKSSEATRALAVKEDILEKELGEIQKLLLAMQEQQHKQLELILAIGTGKLWEGKRGYSQDDQDKIETSNSAVEGAKEISANKI